MLEGVGLEGGGGGGGGGWKGGGRLYCMLNLLSVRKGL